jgi:hypothetical protein
MAGPQAPNARLFKRGEASPGRTRMRRTLALAVTGAVLAGGGSLISPIKVLAFTPPTVAQVQASIAAAVAYLRPLQQVNGSWDSGSFFPVSETAFALITFGTFDGGNFASLSPSDQTQVKKGVLYLLSQQDNVISDQAYGAFPDGPGGNYKNYSTGLAVAALSLSVGADPGLPPAEANGRQALINLWQGPTGLNPGCTTVYPAASSMYCGGWNYDFGASRSDESNTGFAMFGLQSSGGIPAQIAAVNPGWQHNVQEITTNGYAARNDGGGDYEPGITSGPFSSNANDTGSFLFGNGYDGVPMIDPGVTAALKLAQDILDVYELVKTNNDTQWLSGGVGIYHTAAVEDGSCDPNTTCTWNFNGDGGYHYSLWALTKGLGDYIPANLSDPNNWYAKVADLLVNSQLGNGSWHFDGRDDFSAIVATSFSVFALGLTGVTPPSEIPEAGALGAGTLLALGAAAPALVWLRRRRRPGAGQPPY